MRRSSRIAGLLSAALCLHALPAHAAEENRCGWFSNPTPGNAWLKDRDGEWTVGIQGNYEAEGDWPEFKRGQWVVTNGSSYGYGCACMRVTTDSESMRVLTIKSARALPLATCRNDRRLGKAPK
jgi:hypothetical protein